jgi:hypothetical protein
LLWIDNEFSTGGAKIATAPNNCLQRGFYFEDTNVAGKCPPGWPLRAITGYLLDPGLLPAVVSGLDATNTVDYLGGDLPATVRLIRDAADPPAS